MTATDLRPSISGASAVDGPWRAADLSVHCMKVVADDVAGSLWEIYAVAFEPLRPLAAARQVLREDEFMAEMRDPAVWKYVAVRDQEVIGMATLTADLATVPWISPDYYAARYPEQAARRAIFYVPFVCSDPRQVRSGAMWLLVRAFIQRVSAARGVVGYDICTVNDELVRFADRMAAWNRRLGAAAVEQADAQHYYAAQYGPDAQ